MTEEELEMIQAYRLEHQKCALCHAPDRNEPMDIAHIYGGAKRKHEATNILLLCRTCHHHQHNGMNPPITTAHLVRLKWDLGELCASELAEIACYTERYIFDLGNETVIPEYFKELRIGNGSHNHNTRCPDRETENDPEG